MDDYRQIAMHFLKNAGEVVSGVAAGEGLFASDEEFDRRRSICDSCPMRDIENDSCGYCGCPIDNLAMYQRAICEAGKWSDSDDEE